MNHETLDVRPRDPENVRAEYAALAGCTNAVLGFRFTTLGFYVAAIGFIVGRGISRTDAGLLLGITAALWLMDVRNRSLARTFALRGTQIERQFWGYTGSEAYDGFFSRQTKLPLDRAPEPPPLDPGFIWRWRLPFGVGYTLAIDLLFSVVGVYSLYVLIRG